MVLEKNEYLPFEKKLKQLGFNVVEIDIPEEKKENQENTTVFSAIFAWFRKLFGLK